MSTHMDLPLFAAIDSYHSRGSRTSAAERAHGEAKAHEQEALILAWFRANPGRWSPSQVHERVSPVVEGYMEISGHAWPITSVRRALTNLSDRDRYPHSLRPPLRKTEARVDGPMGRKEHLWEMSE